jgi:HAE1 family hydrophobic/amphiphilic exporter-1
MAKSKLPPLNGNPISDLSIKNPVFVAMLMVLLVVVGLLAFTRLPLNLLPEFDQSIVSVTVVYPGAGPNTVADQVVDPIEDALAGVSGVDEISANASENVAVVVVTFVDGVDSGTALQDVREQVAAIRNELPDSIEEPLYEKLDPAASPILTIAVTSTSGQDGKTVRELLENDIIPRIQQADGVGSVDLFGGQERQINVEFDLARLQAYGILPSQVTQAIAAANADVGIGDTMVDGREYNLRSPSAFRTPDEIAEVGISGTSYTVGDVASITDGVAETENYSRLNGADTVMLEIRRQSGTNAVTVAEEAIHRLDEVMAEHPDLKHEIVDDEAEEVRENVLGAIEEILFAVLFAMLVVWFFFRDLRNTLVTVLGLPVIIIATFAAMWVMGITVNIISLLALSVAVGLVIDDAIVVRENIFRHIERGEEPIVASSRASAQVFASVVAMTLTVIVVFVPAAFSTGLIGVIFKSFGLTVAAAMAISFIEAFTMAPATAAYWSGEQQHHKEPLKRKPGEEDLPDEALEEPDRLQRFYERIVRWSLAHRRAMLGITAVIIVFSVLSASSLKFAFLPPSEPHQFSMELKMSPGTPLDETDRTAREIEQILLGDEHIESVLTTVGGDGAENASFLVDLSDDVPTLDMQAQLRPTLAEYPVFFGQPSTQSGTSASVTNRPLQIEIRGVGGIEELVPIAEEVRAAVAAVPGAVDVDSTYAPGKPELQYVLRQDRANDYNLSNATIASTMRALVDGDTATQFRGDGDETDVVVRLRPADRQSVEELGQVRLPAGNTLVPLDALVDIEESSSPTTIRRSDRQDEIIVGANNIDRNVNDVQSDMQAAIAGIALPPGVSVGFGGDTEQQAESFGSLLVAMALAMLLVYMVLATQFNSFLQPLLIMVAMPLSVMGAFLALSLRGLALDMTGMIGMIMLLGLVVKNSILMVDFTNKLQAGGMAKNAAIIRASGTRLRPILMTSLAIMLGSLPAAIGLGEGAELRRSLSTVVIGGVFTSTLLTLLIVPVGYSLLQNFTDRLSSWQTARREQRRRKAKPAPVPTKPPADATPAGD